MIISKFLNKHHSIIVEVLYLAVMIYVFSMYVYPFLSGQGWESVQRVWDRWQTLNAGVLAFSAAVVGFSISKYKVEQDRINELSAVRVYLPNALGKVSAYTEDAKKFVDLAFRKLDDDKYFLETDVPVMPDEVFDVFSHAIKYSSGNVKDRLAKIIELQQILMARLCGLGEFARGKGSTFYVKSQKYEFYYLISEVKYLSDSLFSFARRKTDDIDEEVNIENAFSALGFDLIPEFNDFARRNQGRSTLD